MIYTHKKAIVSLILAGGLLSSASAQVLMLNFRDSGGPSGSNLTNSPYNTADPSFSDTTWNNVSNSDVTSDLFYADGAAATGVAFDLGLANLNTSTVVDLSNNPASASNLGNQTNTGVYSGDSVGKGGIFSGSGPDRLQIGLQVTGLAAGTYEIYVTGRNTNVGNGGNTLPYTYYAGTGAAGNFDFSSYDNASVSFTGTEKTAAWVEAGNAEANYGKFTITLGAGEALNIVSNGDGGTANGNPANRGFLNSVQIVNIPEPGAWAMIFGSVALVGVAFLRRRR